jgi:cytochrome c oxidase assembly protein Cox11
MSSISSINRQILLKLLIASVMMFGFGYALIPIYRAICELTGINILALGEKEHVGTGIKLPSLRAQ